MAILQRPMSPVEAALIAQACSRSDVLWVRPAEGDRHHLLWHVWHEDAVCVVTGEGEQPLPRLGETVEVIVRSKETATRVVAFHARPQTLVPRSRDWESAVDALAAARLNAPDPDRLRDRWADRATVLLLQPVSVTSAVSGDEDTASEAAPPADNPGTTLDRRPFHLGGRGRRARRQARRGDA